METFWKWMFNKRYYLYWKKKGINQLQDRNNDIINPTEQMLVGYKIEYLIEKGVFVCMIGADKNRRDNGYFFETIEEYSNRLSTKIIEIDKDKTI